MKGDDVRPKSIAREMIERFMDFNEYVREYELGRAEGTLLRYLSDVYKALVQTVPAPVKTPEIEEIEVFLRSDGAGGRQQLARRVGADARRTGARHRGGCVTAGARGARHHARRARIHRARCATRCSSASGPSRAATGPRRPRCSARPGSRCDRPTAATDSPADDEWSAARFEQALQPFFEEHSALRTDPTARAPQNTRTTKTERGTWEIVQVLCDAEGDNDWALSATADLEASAKAGRPVLAMRGISR